MNGNLVTGAGYFLRGLAMTFQPGLRRFVMVPLIANVVLFSLMGWLVYELVTDFYDAAMLTVPEWLQFLSWIITPAALAGRWTDDRIRLHPAGVNADLAFSRATRRKGGGGGHWRGGPRSGGYCSALLEVPRALFREIRKFLCYVPMALAVLILTIVPVFNAFAPLAWFLLGAWMMSLQFVDYPMDNHRLPFREVRDACAAHRLSTIGFGGTVAFFTGIPFLNLMVIPAAVIGATLLWCEELRPLR